MAVRSMNATTKVMAILLAIAVAGDIGLGLAYLGQRDKATISKVRDGTAVTTALQCSDGTAKLGQIAAQRDKDAGQARQADQDKAAEHNKAADKIMSTPAAVPGNACASAQAELDGWWSGKAKP